MPPSREYLEIEAAYRRFGREEARDRSALYERFAERIASDSAIIDFLLTLPGDKRQPNLLLAAVRYQFGTPEDWAAFRRCVTERGEALRSLMLSRATQTNEPGRCASLLPVLAQLPGPLALIEVGASAGLCLLPDRYGYDYRRARIAPPTGAAAAPTFPCAVDARTPVPAASPRIVWRAGLDLNPIDISDPAQVAWLEALVWPEQAERLARLRAAIKIAATCRPPVFRGDLRRDLGRLAAEAPREATRVIFHTAVLAYAAPEERAEFARSVMSLCDFWVSNEAPGVFPEIAGRTGTRGPSGRFLLAVNGRPVAWADPHGAALAWIADPPARYNP